MHLPKITIITPSYNQRDYIEQTIISVIEQNYPNVEYIIVDGGSSDGTVDIIRKYEKYLKLWISEPDKGQTDAIVKGLKYATGVFFNWLNSDDYLEQGALWTIAQEYEKNSNALVICGKTHCFFDSNKATSHTYSTTVNKNTTKTILNIKMAQPSMFYRLDVVRQLGGVNTSLHFAFDDELWIRFLCCYGIDKIVFTDKVLAHFRIHDKSKTGSQDWQKFLDERYSVYYVLAQKFNFPDFIVNSIKNLISNYYYQPSEFECNFVNKDEFLAYFCNKFMYDYYKNKQYDYLEFSYKAQRNFYPMTWQSFKLYLKTFVLPRKILEILRK